jgi:hypothetical protein
MKAKLYSDPIRRKKHHTELIDKFYNISTIDQVHDYIKIEHHALYAKALKNIEKCNSA